MRNQKGHAVRQHGLSRLAMDGVCLAVLVFACVKQVHGIDQVLDLTLWDESDYLHQGRLLPALGLLPAEWGPLYPLWYFALSAVWPDPMALHDGNYRLLILLTAVAGYVLLRRVGVQPWLALAGISVYVLSGAPHILPRPTLLALLVILAALSVASLLRAPEDFCAVVGAGLLVASFARPEYFLSFLLGSGLLALLLARRLWRERSRLWRGLATAGAYGLFTLLLVSMLGNPFGNTSNRRFYAFCQHFAVNYVQRTGFEADPWGECPKVIQVAFGEVDTVGSAARANPDAFLMHLGMNLKQYPMTFLSLFLQEYGGTWPFFSARRWPPTPRELLEYAGHLLLLMVALSPLVLVLNRRKHLLAALAQPQVWRTGGVLLVVLLPIALSAVLIAPRTHYLVPQGVLGLTFLAVLGSTLAQSSGAPAGGGLRLTVGLALVLALASPDLARRYREPAPPRLEHRRFVESFRSLGLPRHLPPGEEVGVLDTHGGLAVYLGEGYRRVPAYRKQARESFTGFLRRERVHVFIADPRLEKYENLANDPALRALLAEPGAFGFVAAPLPGTPYRLMLPSSWEQGEGRPR
ncbi:MAG TPA: hypothetical protein VK539_30910 [Myxococcaceae bacterium]|nr:hypothetical protein [Myxococcaceae bacterium]